MFKNALLGGTFDHFHKGHKHFIETAIRQSHHLTIGITTSRMYQHKPLAEEIQPYEVRLHEVQNFLKENNWTEKSQIIPIDDMYANTLEEKDIDSLFIVESGKENAELINKERQKINFPKLEIIVVDQVLANDKKPISSRRIRKGEIDREGTVYMDFFAKTLTMPETLRETLKEPFGEIVTNVSDVVKDGGCIVTVGDIVTYTFLAEQLFPDIAIIDFKSKRTSLTDTQMLAVLPRSAQSVQNPAGTITSDAVKAYQDALGKYFSGQGKSTIFIEGEEDLLALPAMLLAPLGSVVLYGLQNVGMIAVSITEAKKQQAKEIIEQFSF